jgi:prepilin-type N-terminal cleavage/methylation domain-containing protein
MSCDTVIRQPAAAHVREVRGFSLIELMLVVALLGIVGAMAVPMITNMMAGMRVSASARLVERELQTARLRAVATNRTMRVRFNCPAAGQFRLVEILGTPSVPAPNDADSAATTRCGLAQYPYPDSNTDWFDVPNNDGPLNTLDTNVVFMSTQTLEFRPDGTVHYNAGIGNPWPAVPADAPVSLTLQQANGSSTAKAATQRTIQVNGVGKITLQ